MDKTDISIQWHPAFCAAAELELIANRDDLTFLREYNLSKKPLQIDLLVVEKKEGVSIENEIGRIFRKHNIIEYKSPGDGLTIDDFFKALGYACIYKGLGETVDAIPVDQVTVSLVREGKPEELLRSLSQYGLAVKKQFDGIYYIEGLLIPAQVVVTRELDGEKHRSLRVLSREALEEDICGFIEGAQGLTEQGDRANVDAVLQVSVSANFGVYDEIRRRYPTMCEAMRLLMKDEIERELDEARLGKARETAYELNGMGLSIDKIAQAVKVSLATVQQWFDERAAAAK